MGMDMNRRSAVKSMTVLGVGISLFAGCTDHLILSDDLQQGLTFNPSQRQWIDAISEAILPKSDLTTTTFESFTDYVAKMVAFRLTPEEQLSFVNGYNLCTTDIQGMYDVSTRDIDPEQIITFFKTVVDLDLTSASGYSDVALAEAADKIFFCKQIRSMSIEHLTSSQEYQEGVIHYQLIPGYFHACVPI